tara:strand:+ start:207 stop:899 length:693 start_codon:yes stop_codon:yes gene_type:complete
MTTGSRIWSIARRMQITPAHCFNLRGIHWIDEEDDLSYQPTKLLFDGSAYLNGYWQSQNYFADFESHIRKEFHLTEPLDRLYRQRITELNIHDSITVSLHVRRGDYATNPVANSVHGTLGPDYYKLALQKIEASLASSFTLLVFSDDIPWARANLDLPISTIYIEPNIIFPQIDMHLMASCNHHIIANSSYSWWGAWLNPNHDKLVIAPTRWFAKSTNTGDLIPSKWVRL